MLYSYEIIENEDGFVGYVTDLDFKTKPQKTIEEAESVLTEGLSAFVEVCFRAKKKMIPLPSTDCKDKLALYVPIKLQLRILLWNTMLEKKVKQSELAQTLEVTKAMVNQMVNGKGNISVEKYEEVLQLLDKYPNITL